MVIYNPKDWWKLIFAFHKSDTFRIMLPGIIGVAIYTGIISYIENDLLKVQFKNTTAIHSLVGFVLSLLLVFRTNTAYERWWTGRAVWGNVVNDSRNLAIKVESFIHEDSIKCLLRELIIAFPFFLKEHLRSSSNIDLPLSKTYTIKYFTAHDHKPLSIIKAISKTINDAYRSQSLSEQQVILIQNDISGLSNSLGSCERIKNTPIPYSYNIFLKKVIFLYVFTMPIGFVVEFGYWAMPIVALIFYIFTSIEIIAEEIEDPFGTDANDLPTDTICENIRKNVEEIIV
jgi:putative membrane protein